MKLEPQKPPWPPRFFSFLLSSFEFWFVLLLLGINLGNELLEALRSAPVLHCVPFAEVDAMPELGVSAMAGA